MLQFVFDKLQLIYKSQASSCANFQKDDFFLTYLSGNFVLLCKRSVNYGLKEAINFAVHDFGESFAVGLVYGAGLTSGLQSVDDQLYAEVGVSTQFPCEPYDIPLFCSSGYGRWLICWAKGLFVTLPT
ncbi:hypothetical protein OAN13_01840 [Opitutales bacterium]|nr:hypothetical protein [Opitutales bacterium]